jgi:hypothetical protein
MQKTLTEKYKALEIAVRLRIAAKILKKGIEGRHRSDKVLAIRKDEHQFNLEGRRYLTEITPTELIDNEGYSYGHSSLTLEQICEAVDNA